MLSSLATWRRGLPMAHSEVIASGPGRLAAAATPPLLCLHRPLRLRLRSAPCGHPVKVTTCASPFELHRRRGCALKSPPPANACQIPLPTRCCHQLQHPQFTENEMHGGQHSSLKGPVLRARMEATGAGSAAWLENAAVPALTKVMHFFLASFLCSMNPLSVSGARNNMHDAWPSLYSPAHATPALGQLLLSATCISTFSCISRHVFPTVVVSIEEPSPHFACPWRACRAAPGGVWQRLLQGDSQRQQPTPGGQRRSGRCTTPQLAARRFPLPLCAVS